MVDWLRRWFSAQEEKGGPTRMILLAAVVVGALLIVWPVFNFRSQNTAVSTVTASTLPTTDLEKRLSLVLSNIQDAGQVDLTLFYASSGSKEYAVDKDEEIRETNETSQGGLKRVIKETRVSQQLAGDSQQGYLVDAHSPEVVGALVVADGANQAAVREEICWALMSLLDLPAHRITVLPRQ
ncbi:MAG: hypothetical protein ACM3NT_11655 [Methylocystaceae bacterium]